MKTKIKIITYNMKDLIVLHRYLLYILLLHGRLLLLLPSGFNLFLKTFNYCFSLSSNKLSNWSIKYNVHRFVCIFYGHAFDNVKLEEEEEIEETKWIILSVKVWSLCLGKLLHNTSTKPAYIFTTNLYIYRTIIH